MALLPLFADDSLWSVCEETHQQPALSWPTGWFLRRPLRGQERWGMTEPGPLLCSLENARAGRNDPLHMWEAEEGFQPPEGEDKRVKIESE